MKKVPLAPLRCVAWAASRGHQQAELRGDQSSFGGTGMRFAHVAAVQLVLEFYRTP